MQTGVKQVFYFHAGATSAGGYAENPFRFIPTPCSASLPSTGGQIVTRAAGFSFENVVSCKLAYTFVSGRPAQMNGPWTHRTVSVVEGFSLLGGQITADRIVSQMFVEQPAAGGGPRRISFAGSHIDNLRVGKQAITLTMNPGFFPAHEPAVDAYNVQATVTPSIQWPSLWTLATRQAAGITQTKNVPSWVPARYSWVAATKNAEQPPPAGYSVCSLIDKIDGMSPGSVAGHCFELPNIGRIFLGELTVHPQAAALTMFRAELGCKFEGQLSLGDTISNGITCPPS